MSNLVFKKGIHIDGCGRKSRDNMIHKLQPAHFNSKFETVSCFVEVDNKFLLLQRQSHKPQGEMWGFPAGKVDNNETPLEAIMRELKEETGLEVLSNRVTYFDKIYVSYPEYDFIFHMFVVKMDKQPKITINITEHKDFRWVMPKEAFSMNLIQDLDSCLKLYYTNLPI